MKHTRNVLHFNPSNSIKIGQKVWKKKSQNSETLNPLEETDLFVTTTECSLVDSWMPKDHLAKQRKLAKPRHQPHSRMTLEKGIHGKHNRASKLLQDLREDKVLTVCP